MEPLFVGMGTYTLDNLIEVFRATRPMKRVIFNVILCILIIIESVIIVGTKITEIIYYDGGIKEYMWFFFSLWLMGYSIWLLIRIKGGVHKAAKKHWERNLATYQRELEEEYIFFEEYFVMHNLCSNATLNFGYWKIVELRETEHTYVIIVEGGANAVIEKSRFVLGHPFAFREFVLAKAVNAKIKF